MSDIAQELWGCRTTLRPDDKDVLVETGGTVQKG